MSETVFDAPAAQYLNITGPYHYVFGYNDNNITGKENCTLDQAIDHGCSIAEAILTKHAVRKDSDPEHNIRPKHTSSGQVCWHIITRHPDKPKDGEPPRTIILVRVESTIPPTHCYGEPAVNHALHF